MTSLERRVCELEAELKKAQDRIAQLELALEGQFEAAKATTDELLGVLDDLRPAHKLSCAFAMHGRDCTCEAGEWERFVTEKLDAIIAPPGERGDA